MTVRSAKTRSAVGSSKPNSRNRDWIPSARRRPKCETDERSEDADDERLEDDRGSTCRREAPIVRSVANSRVRCATVIEKVLKMTNAPTKSAMPANVEQEVADDGRELADLVLRLFGLRGSRLGGHARRAALDWIALDELVLGRALLRGDRDRVELALAVKELLRRRDGEHRERRRPEAVDASVLAEPDELERPLGLSVAISTVSPSAKPCSSAVPASITTSSGEEGQRPSRRFSGLN